MAKKKKTTNVGTISTTELKRGDNMKVKELNNVCAITVGRRYFDRLTGDLIDYNNMNRKERMAFKERTIYLIYPSDGDDKGFDVYLY